MDEDARDQPTIKCPNCGLRRLRGGLRQRLDKLCPKCGAPDADSPAYKGWREGEDKRRKEESNDRKKQVRSNHIECVHCGREIWNPNAGPRRPEPELQSKHPLHGAGRMDVMLVCPNCGNDPQRPQGHFWEWEHGVKPALGCLAILIFGTLLLMLLDWIMGGRLSSVL